MAKSSAKPKTAKTTGAAAGRTVADLVAKSKQGKGTITYTPRKGAK